ncbi:xanthine dehydrogenase family protein subunit M [uncultured Desulfovibrio sp.]|uniref:FAD binding domain-containing protein n=1 Tax=uncultured Desulfovibrio sp. TaxID=167968 RepID=UPI00265CE021|nr:xanthine dehydrogenase family protein subunit M [uncultured Desulfovibrio sp.]
MKHIRPLFYEEPSSVSEASEMLSTPGSLVLAGGTDITVMLRRKPMDGVTLVNLKRILGLDGIRKMEDGSLRLGALVTVGHMGRVLTAPEHAALRIACNSLGTPAVRNLATLGGNIGRASPASDVIPALLSLDAVVILESAGGSRRVPLEQLLQGPGRLDSRPGEFVTAVELPPREGGVGSYWKAGRIRGADCALAGVGVSFCWDGDTIVDPRVAMTSVGPTCLRSAGAERVLRGARLDEEVMRAAADAAAGDARPITDLRASAAYRKELVRGLLMKNLRSLAAQERRSC